MRDAVTLDASCLAEEGWSDPARGSVRWKSLFSADRTATDSMVCGIALMAKGEDFALHSHPEAEIYFGLEGEGIVMVNGLPQRLAPGVAIFIPGGAVHGVPRVSGPLKWLYVFARDSFDQISYSFLPQPESQTA
jgi:quercetin dioxygenase-like cupin family protein